MALIKDSAFKLCPFCKEQLREEAVKCRFCGEWIEPIKLDSARKLTTAKPVLPPPKSIEPNAAKAVALALDDYDSRQSAPPKVDDKNKTKPTVSATKGTGTKSIWRVVVGALLMGGTYHSLKNFQQTYPTDLSYNITFFTLGFLFVAVGSWLFVSYLRPRKGYGLLVLLVVCAISAGSFAGFLKVRSAEARSESNKKFGNGRR